MAAKRSLRSVVGRMLGRKPPPVHERRAPIPVMPEGVPVTEEAMLKAFRFTENQMEKFQLLAEMRHETVAQAAAATLRNLMSVVPASMRERNLVLDAPVKSLEVVEGLVRVELNNGRVLWNFPSRLRYENLYYTFRDKLPKFVKAETYGPFHDVRFRYLNAGLRPFFPSYPGAVVIEGGAYIGWKALGYYDKIERDGKVIAVEIGGEQFAMLQRNVDTNHLGGKIIPLRCGIWKEKGTMEAKYQVYASHSLLPPDEHAHYTRSEIVETDTLDNIIDNHGLEVVDYINLQTNGAEGAALEGLVRNLDRVKIVYVGAHYHIDGVPQDKYIVEWMQGRGYKILAKYRGSITAATPRWASQYKANDNLKLNWERSTAGPGADLDIDE